MYKFYLDGTLVENPQDDRGLTTTIKRNANLNGLLTQLDGRLEFGGDGYVILYNAFFDSLCTEIDILITEDCENTVNVIYEGVLKLTDVFLDEQKKTARISVEDNTFFAYINNNKNIEIKPQDESDSKSGLEITQLNLYSIRVFDPDTGVWQAFNVEGWLVFDLLQFILDYITDGRVELQSDLLSGNGDEAQLFITQGRSLHVDFAPFTPDNLNISFKDLYDLILKLYNVSFRVTPPSGGNRAILRIEKSDFFFQEESDIQFTDIQPLTVEAKRDEIYSSVKLGSAEHDSVTKTLSTYITQPLFGWIDEQYHMAGQCNTDKELSLGHSYQTDSGVIQDIAIGKSKDFYDSKVIIEVDNVDDVAFTADAVQHAYYGAATPPFFYNMGINNEQILSRRAGFIHNSVQEFVSTILADQFKVKGDPETVKSNDPGIAPFYSTTSGPPANSFFEVYQPWEYDDDTSAGLYNYGGHYDTATFQYTIPATGDYSFQHAIEGSTFGMVNTGTLSTVVSRIIVKIGFENTTTGQIYVASRGLPENSTFVKNFATTIPCTVGDVIEPRIAIQFSAQGNFPVVGFPPPWGVTIGADSFFACNGAANGGDIITANTDEFKAIKWLFDYPMTQEDFETIKSDPTKMFTFTSHNIERKGWIQDLRYDHFKNKAKIQLISDNATNKNSQPTLV